MSLADDFGIGVLRGRPTAVSIPRSRAVFKREFQRSKRGRRLKSGRRERLREMPPYVVHRGHRLGQAGEGTGRGRSTPVGLPGPRTPSHACLTWGAGRGKPSLASGRIAYRKARSPRPPLRWRSLQSRILPCRYYAGRTKPEDRSSCPNSKALGKDHRAVPGVSAAGAVPAACAHAQSVT